MNKPTETIPLVDLSLHNEEAGEGIRAAIARVSGTSSFILGREVEAFEREIAAYVGTDQAIGVSSGTDALLLVLLALGVGEGDLVATTPLSFFATAEVIARVGATPLFVDVDPLTFNMDPARLELLGDAHKGRLKALMPVHLYGRAGDVEAMDEICSPLGVPIIEDAAQAIGASLGCRRCGSLGLAGCFSFFPTKNLGGWGDGGMITTNDPDLAALIRRLRSHGSGDKVTFTHIGGNFRLDALQAAILSAKLHHLEAWTEKRRANGACYRRLLTDRLGLQPEGEGTREGTCPGSEPSTLLQSAPVVIPGEHPGGRHVYNQFVILARDRDRLQAHLKGEGIQTAIYYRLPLHLQPAISTHGWESLGDLPNAQFVTDHCLALPIATIGSTQIERVVDSMARFYGF